MLLGPRVRCGIVAHVAILVLLSILMSVVAAGDVAAQSHDAVSQEEGQQPNIRVLESDRDRVVLDVSVPDYLLTRQWVEDIQYDVLSLPGWGLTQEAGAPQLPTLRMMLGIPPDAEVQLRVLEVAVEESETYRVIPAAEKVLQSEDGLPDPFVPLEPWLTVPQFEERFLESPAIYGKNALYSGAVAQVVEDGYIRSQRVVAIDLQPIQYNPVSLKIRFSSQFQVELSFSYPHDQKPASGGLQRAVLSGAKALMGFESSGYEQVLSDQLLNYASARDWRSRSAQTVDSAALLTWPLPEEAYKIFVTQNGLYRLTYQDLASTGIPLASEAIDPREIQLFLGGEEVAIQVVGEGDGSFDQSDYVLFYGQAIRNKYTDRNVYWLTYGHALGRRMPMRNGESPDSMSSPAFFPTHLPIEEDKGYFSQWQGSDSTDRWYWHFRRVFVDEPADVMVDVDLGQVSMEPEMASLRVLIMGGNEFGTVNPDHHAVFYVNGHLIGEHWWDGMDTVEVVKLDFPQSYLTSGANTFRTELPGDTGAAVEYVFIDRYELSYGHALEADSDRLEFTQVTTGVWEYEVTGFAQPDVKVYDISDPLTVTEIVSPAIELSETTFTLRFSDTVPSTRTYLALTPDHWLSPESISLDFPSGLHAPTNGADYIIVSHADFVPAAQKLAAHRTGQGLRTIVVNVEDVYDEFGYGLSVPHAIRDFLRYAYESWQPPAPMYVVLLGDGTYDPKNNIDQGVVSYLTPYLAFVDPWMGETATDNWFVAVAGEDFWPDLILGRMPANTLAEANTMVDKTILYEQSMGATGWSDRLVFVAGRQPDPKGAGSFHDLSNTLIGDYVPAFYDISRIYLGKIPGSTCASGAECKQQLVGAINSGALLVNFIGHGSVIQWDGEFILDHDAIDELTNIDRFPVMLPMTCLEGMFTHPYPDYPCISESVVRAEDRGAVASWGPTGLGVAYGHDELNKGFLDAVLVRGIRELGLATYAGKLRLYNAGHSLEQIQEYTVFGDPALHVQSLDVVDLGVEKFVDTPEEIAPGDVLTFTLTFTNAGPDTAMGVVLTDQIPSVLVNPTVVYSSSEVLSQREGITFSWTITDLPPHSGGEIRIRAEVSSETEPPIVFYNKVEITSSTRDHFPGNNRVSLGVGTSRRYLPLILKRK